MNQRKLTDDALSWVRQNKSDLFDMVVGESQYDISIVEDQPAASFMAGTPGAGKTEVSKRFIEQFAVRPVRIDADEFRHKIPGYTGSNSHLVQPAASLAVDKVLERVFQKRYSFILDGTFAFGRAVQNLKRAHRRGYTMQIFFVYQDPVVAWEFTRIREAKEGRCVPREVFINSYFASRANVLRAKSVFGDELSLYLIVKDYQKQSEVIHDNVDDIDKYTEKIYTKDELERILK